PLVLDLTTRLSRWADTAQPRPTKVLLERLRLVEHAAEPVETSVELDVAINDLRVQTRVDHHIGPASEHVLAVPMELIDQAVELLAAVSAREDRIQRRGETRRIEHGLGGGCERAVPELLVRNETGELEQARPHEASRADQVEQCVLREYGPALALPTLEHFVEPRHGHRNDDHARDQGREKRVAKPEFIVDEIPGDRPGKDDHTEDADDPRRAHVRPKRVGAARTNSATSHLLPSILR